jgi:hypothetical protein
MTYGYDALGRRISEDQPGAAAPPPPADTVWVDAAPPAGASLDSSGGDSWDWESANPAPQSGALDLQSSIQSGPHPLHFTGATTPLSVGAGDVLFAYVWLDPANVPSEVMLQWNVAGSWSHRACWGATDLSFGTDGTSSQQLMGSLPAAGQWVRLEAPASTVGLHEGYGPRCRYHRGST